MLFIEKTKPYQNDRVYTGQVYHFDRVTIGLAQKKRLMRRFGY